MFPWARRLPSLAATHLDISYNLRFALLALANSEVSG
jgi:hypothetical protein